MTRSVRDLLNAIEQQNRWLQKERERLNELKRKHDKQLRDYDIQIDAAWVALGRALLPSLDPARCDEAAALTRLGNLSARGAAAAKTRLEKYYQGKIAAIVEDHPPEKTEARINALDIRIAELERDMEPLKGPVEGVEAMLHFQELIRTGYGTDDYEVPFWKFSYYRHWKHGDLVIEAHGEAWKAEDFGQLRDKYLDQRVALDTFLTEHSEARREHHEVTSAAQDLARWREQLARVDETVLEQLRAKAKEHLELVDMDDVLEMLGKDPSAGLAAKRVAGVMKKKDYLEAFYERYVAGMERDVNKMIAKNKRHAVKYRRPKHAYTTWNDHEFNRRFGDRSGKWNQRFGRYERARDHMWGWNEYDRYDPYDDRPWFIYFDDGSLKGRFLDDVSEYKHDRARRDHAEASAARAVHEPEDAGLLEDWS
jgi:uncharacterized protein YjiS (DUF1127 family)